MVQGSCLTLDLRTSLVNAGTLINGILEKAKQSSVLLSPYSVLLEAQLGAIQAQKHHSLKIFTIFTYASGMTKMRLRLPPYP